MKKGLAPIHLFCLVLFHNPSPKSCSLRCSLTGLLFLRQLFPASETLHLLFPIPEKPFLPRFYLLSPTLPLSLCFIVPSSKSSLYVLEDPFLFFCNTYHKYKYITLCRTIWDPFLLLAPDPAPCPLWLMALEMGIWCNLSHSEPPLGFSLWSWRIRTLLLWLCSSPFMKFLFHPFPQRFWREQPYYNMTLPLIMVDETGWNLIQERLISLVVV